MKFTYKFFIGLVIVFSIFGQGLSQSTDFTLCQTYLDSISNSIANKKPLPPTFGNTLLYSGRTLNDEGDVEKCRSLPQMTFVRLTLTLPNNLEYYLGFCMYEVCNAEVMNSNSQLATAELLKILQTIKDIFPHQQDIPKPPEFQVNLTEGDNQTVITYVPYQEDTQSKATAGYIIALFTIVLVSTCSILAPILKLLQRKKDKAILQDNTRYQTQINYTQGATSTSMISQSNSQISRPSHTYSGPQPSVSMTNGNTVSQVAAATGRPKKEPFWWRVVQCWNLPDNVKKMFTLKSNNDDLLVFNGIRSLCFMQVIFGHEFYLHMNYMSNPQDLMIIQNRSFVLFLFSCLYSVDVFFWLGGFFLAYVVADEKQQRNFSMKKPVKTAISFLFAIINRVFRIFPCYFLVLMFYWRLSPFVGSSPTWDVFMHGAALCDTRWWQNLLFIDNLFPGQGKKCVPWGWYLSNDFQMFIFGMILLIIYQNNRLIGKISVGVCFAVFQSVSIYLSFKYEFMVPSNIQALSLDHYYEDYYIKPWARISPYFVGLFFGILYKEHQFDKAKNKCNGILTKMQKFAGHSLGKYIFYALGFGLWMGLVFAPHQMQVHGNDYWNADFQHFWFGTCRTWYVIATTCFMIPGMLGSKDLIAKFFSNTLFAFLQRLSFGGYLTHYIIILFTLWYSKDAVYYDSENLIGMFFSEFFFTLIAAAIVALIIEIPIMNLAQILLGGRKPSSAPVQKLERVKLEELTQEGNTKSLNINKSQISDNESSQISNLHAKSITVQSKQMQQN
ncbi:acyltransferase family protein (macronuclear) [Tetrahymena thermophila SB210]|uniref:Acyltransferase family protein n=1 Tax=Tetrahymena thermophila (strain SB210) TaxID=312017 RepID=I7M5W7_TETTS|nr:acyltransferase family protein [Tetrahymena thermophila SB210]EAR83718.3 acyltransferase family protein [Tetrahymena thermophila SB210]|eukprot:XP_001031381.3 acyltransferase family protein [Tetrahymena thermophila SB210]